MNSELPATIPLFPLPNVVLFPGVALPLHIFEPRYRDMVRDALASPHRLIGMILLRGEWRADYHACPDVFATGCAGRIVSSEPLPDGRYNILLHGVREFTLAGENREETYRRGMVQWRTVPPGELPDGARGRLRDLIGQLATGERAAAALKLFDDTSVSDELMVNFLCFVLDFAPVEKQGLLEAPSLAERAEQLCDLTGFAVSARRSPHVDPGRSYH